MSMQRIDLEKPMIATRHLVPLAIRIAVPSSPDSVNGGTPQSIPKITTYVQVDFLPEDLKQRVLLALQIVRDQM